MIEVFIAEDEFGAREQIKLLVSRFPEFQVVGEADNGDKAVEEVRRLRPDLLLTDIRMPGKSGLELVEEISSLKPRIEMVVISGYSDFEYAQSAMKSGCQDYLLKPVSPKQFRQMMERLAERIMESQMEERARLFRAIVRNQQVEEDRLKKYFPCENYHLALVRKLGLPGAAERDGNLQIMSEMQEWNCIYGRDVQEALYLWPMQAFGVQNFEKRQQEKGEEDGVYFTVLSYSRGIRVEEIPGCVRELYGALDRQLVLGKSQVLRMEHLTEREKGKKADLHPLEHFVQKQEWEKAEKELAKLFAWYEENSWPLRRIESDISYLLADLARKMNQEADFRGYMEEIYCYARDMKELQDALLDYIHNTFQEQKTQAEKVDTEQFLENVKAFIRENAKRTLSLQEVSETFHVSLSYMSRMFKKYTGMNFNEYLTKLRIEEACRLFQENPGYFVKDVADMVGIADQFYFSRLFRSVTGKTPSQYVKDLDENHT
ncbi:MAG: response regulator [Eubacteriales bacterium]|nr:response regulator [Eubacteriales bacterium]